MHSALLRRINIQRSEQLSQIGINPLSNFFCIGDSKGFIQIINYSQLIAQSQPISRDESFSQNQNCFQLISNIHHKYSISLITWNVCYDKITTVDIEGTMVVWKKKNNFYDVEMVNKRESSFIKDIKWSKNGEYICFVYDDGKIYTGLVEGSHEWYNYVNKGLAFVEFSPDNKKLLIANKKERIYIFSMNGQQIGELNLSEPYNTYDIVSIDWWCDYRKYYNEHLIKEKNNPENKSDINSINYNNKKNNGQTGEVFIKETININEYNIFSKHLMIAFRNGILLFFDDENDKEPRIIKTELTKIIGAQWEPKGTYFIVAGNIDESKLDNKSENNIKSIILFYNLEGEMIKYLVCPNKIFSFSMGNSTTIALEAQNIIYTGFIKFDYKWTLFNSTIIVGYLIGDNKYNVIYLDIENNAKMNKNIYNLLGIISNDNFCVLLTENKEAYYNILFTNNFGNLNDTKKCPIKPILYAINNDYLFISDGNYIYMLIFKGKIIANKKKEKKKDIDTNSNISNSLSKVDNKLMKELVFFIDDEKFDINKTNYEFNTYIENPGAKKTDNLIIAMTISYNYLFIARSHGNVNQYELSSLKLEKKFNFPEKIKKMGVSPFETYLWTIDIDDILRIHNIKYQNNEKENKLIKEFSQKEVWELEWVHKSEDFDDNFNDTLTFVTVEKNKLYFYNDLKHEGDEPFICNDYLARYIDNEAIALKLEDVIRNKNDSNINPNNYIKIYENHILAQFNNMLDTNKNLDEIYNFVKKHPSKNLWKRLSHQALENLDLETAQKSMLQMNDFNGLEFLNKIKNEKDPELQKAQIAQFNSDYEEASKLFSKSNRNDLNLEMLMKLGKWDKVSEIMSKDKNDKNTKEEHIKTAYNNYADELFEKKEFDKAEEYYNKSGNIKGLTNCYFEKEEYDKASKMLEVIPEEDEYLEEIGDKFLSVGMTKEAVIAYTKHGNIKKGIESYINSNQWEEAIDLSAKNGFIYMQELVDKFSDQFRLSGKKLDLVNLYRKANMSVEVHKYLCEIAQDMRMRNVSPIIIKKIYVLAALELERYKIQINQQIEEENLINAIHELPEKKINYLDEALKKDIDNIKNNHWRGAEAYHFYLLCQVQLYKKQYKDSCKTAMRLKFYEDILGTEVVYKLIGICSYMNKCFKFLADAMAVLCNDKSINKILRKKFEEFSKEFFLKNNPENLDEKFYKCPNPDCNEPISEYDTYCNSCGYVMFGCVLSGKSILDDNYFKCKRCRNKTIKYEVKNKPFKHCPLCHVTLFEKKEE